MAELESGKVANEKVTTYTVKKEDGTQMVEKIVQNKDTGEVKRFVDNEEVKIEEAQEKKPVVVQYHPGNEGLINIKLMEMVINQLKEMNYYVRQLAEKSGDISDKKVKEAIENNG